MDNQDFFNLMKTPDGPSAVVLSSDSSWTFNSDSDTSLPTSRGAVDVVEICPSVAVKICPAGKTTNTIRKNVNPQPDSKPTNAHVISPTVTDEQATDEQSTDKQATDEQSTDKQATVEQSTDKQATDEQSTDEQATDEHAPTVAPQQGHTSSPGDDAGNLQTSMGIRSGITAKARNMSFQSGDMSFQGGDMSFQSGDMSFQSGDMKRRIRGASISSIDTENREPAANRRKPIVDKTFMLNTDKRIIKVYMNQSNKVSTKPAPFLQRSSSYINRQVTQRETDRKNYMMMKKLISVKAEVSSFRLIKLKSARWR